VIECNDDAFKKAASLMKSPYQHIVSLTALVLTTSTLIYGMQIDEAIPDPEINVNKDVLAVLRDEMYGEISKFSTPKD
jgi:hypothetical protein